MSPRLRQAPPRILTRFGLSGFKSHFDWNELELRELTILCGANSSGKSSVMQPLLLLKQTMDALPLDVGPLKFDGPNVYFSDSKQFLSARPDVPPSRKLELFLELTGQISARLSFKPKPPGVVLEHIDYSVKGQEVRLKEGQAITANADTLFDYGLLKPGADFHGIKKDLRAVRHGSFLIGRGLLDIPVQPEPAHRLSNTLKKLIHIPGLRGNPSRNYARTVPSEGQPGLFHDRIAGLIASWQDEKEPRLQRLNAALEEVGLTWKIESRIVDASSMELRVGRTMEFSRVSTHDTVNIADVGFGVSQALPVLTALVSAEPGQLVTTGLVRRFRRYYEPVRLPLPVHHRRTASAFPMRPAQLRWASRGSPGSRAWSFRACEGSPTAQDCPRARLVAREHVAFRFG